MLNDKLITINNLEITFGVEGGAVKAVDNISFDVKKGEIFALVGESGCGKSTTALSLMRLIQEPGRISGGEIIFDGKDILKLSKNEICDIRGKEIGMIFQNPLDSLNPVYSIGWQMEEGLIYDKMPKSEAKRRALDTLKDVRISDPEQRIKGFPHEISGGKRQRIMIGMMLSRNPKLLIADEPTTALDVTIQAQILELIKELREKHNTAILMITHDFGIVAEIADRVGVMYAGNIVEIGDVFQIFENPCHPYTKLLMNALPKITKNEGRLEVIPGNVPNLADPPAGCKFHPRCPKAKEKCSKDKPVLIEAESGHFYACFQEEK